MMLVNKKQILDAAKRVASAAATRTTLPALKQIRIEGTGESLTMTCTDLDITARESAAIEDGEWVGEPRLVSAKGFINALKKTKSAEVEIGICGEGLRVGMLRLPFLHSAEDFPHTPWLATTPQKVGGAKIRRAFELALPCICQDETRASLMGLWLDAEGVAATDGHRLARVRFDTGLTDGYLIPRKGVQAALKADKKAPWSIGRQGDDAVFQIGALTLFARLIPGRFPKTSNVLEGAQALIATVAAKELCEAAKLAKQFGDKGDDFLTELQFAGEHIHMAHEGVAIGVECEQHTHAVTFRMNAKYIQEALRHLRGKVNIYQKGGKGGLVIISPLDETGVTQAIMPIEPIEE